MRRSSRTQQRGAAAVEAAVIFPVIVLFLSYMFYFHNMQKMEFKIMATARYMAWTAASHGCDTGTGGSTTQTGTSTTGGAKANTGAGTKRLGGIIAIQLATDTGSSDASPFPNHYANVTRSHSVYVPCNEKVNPKDPVWLEIFNLAKSMVGPPPSIL